VARRIPVALELDKTALRRDSKSVWRSAGGWPFGWRGVFCERRHAEEALPQATGASNRLRDRSRFRPGWCGLRFSWRWTRRALRDGASSLKRCGRLPRPDRRPKTCGLQRIRTDDWLDDGGGHGDLSEKSRLVLGCQRWTVIRSKKWQSCSKWKSRSTHKIALGEWVWGRRRPASAHSFVLTV